MKKTLFYTTNPVRRINYLKASFTNWSLLFCSWPRLILEVFLRKNMGERYFRLYTVVVVALVLFLAPLLPYKDPEYNWYNHRTVLDAIIKFPTYYAFILLFLYMGIKRHLEMRRQPSAFDFGRYSLSRGDVNPLFYELKIAGKTPTIRTIETLYEPGFFFIISIIMSVFNMSCADLLFTCSIIYSASSFAIYHLGDEFILDKIDELICNEELVDSFVNDKKPEETRGFTTMGYKPDDPELRRKIVKGFSQDDDLTSAK